MDFDDAYANIAHIRGAESFVLGWPKKAAAFRDLWPQKQLDIAYGDDPRHCFDLFFPKGETRGLFIFLHGGYWRAFAKDDWSQVDEQTEKEPNSASQVLHHQLDLPAKGGRQHRPKPMPGPSK